MNLATGTNGASLSEESPAESLGLSHYVRRPLLEHLGAAGGGARTVGEVLALYRSGELGEVPGLGPSRVEAVRVALERAGLLP